MTLLIVVAAAYFLFVVVATWWWLAPRVHGDAAAAPGGASSSVPKAPRRTSARWTSAVLVLAALPAIALGLRWWQPFDGFDHTVSREVNPQVAALLAGEQLVAPKPLPPALFSTPEVVQALPMAATASREWALLDPEFRQRLLMAVRLMRERHGIEIVLLEGYRSHERQAQLSALGPQVTLASAGASWHQAGLAADCAFLFDGRIVITEQDPRAARAYGLYGEIAQSLGLVWGGTWRNLKDLGHVELRRASVQPRQPRG